MTTAAEKLQTIVDCKSAIKRAIINKGGQVGDLTTYADAIANLPSSSTSIWTGHADVEGLKAIGWTDEDIAYFQEHGVNWDEEDDEYHKVSDDNKALYEVITLDNAKNYANVLEYLPKISTEGYTSLNRRFQSCTFLKGIPMLDTSNITEMVGAFLSCKSLTCIPQFNLNKVTTSGTVFEGCTSLQYIHDLSIDNTNSIAYMFQDNKSLKSVNLSIRGLLSTLSYAFYGCGALVKVTGNINAENVSDFKYFLYNCVVLQNFKPILDMKSAKNVSSFAYNCLLLQDIRIKNLPLSISFASSTLLSKESLLYMIENEAATSAITITLSALAYARLNADSDILAALDAHPNITIASA